MLVADIHAEGIEWLLSRVGGRNAGAALIRAANQTAWQIRGDWQEEARHVFDRPTTMTINAVVYEKATPQRPAAIVKLRDNATKGTPPVKYLLPQVAGGQRRMKAMERLLQRAGVMPEGMHAVPGKGAPLDAHGNVPPGVVRRILSQMRAGLEAGYTSNETDDGKAKRARREKKRGGGGSYFVVQEPRGSLLPGIYERITFARGSAVRSIFHFVGSVRYRERYDVMKVARNSFNDVFFDKLEVELSR